MNRVGLVVSFVAFLISGAIFAAVGYRVMTRHDSAVGDVKYGSESVADADYQKLPPDGESEWMTGFTLTERSGKQVEWKDLEGKVRLVSFFFSSCPGNCLRQNQTVGEIQQGFLGKDVVCVSITCDPDTDTPERLREYAVKLNASPDQWLFFTGRMIYLQRVAAELFGVALAKGTHSEKFIVCDKWGKIRGTFEWNRLDELAKLRLLVDKLLAEAEPPAESS